MIKQRSSSEAGELQPVQEEWGPESLEYVARFAEQLGPDGLNAVHRILRAERDLRTIASVEPEKFIHALESADQLTDVRAALVSLIERATEITKPAVTTNSLGAAAINHSPK